MKLLGSLLMLTCAALAQAPDLKSASGYPKMVQKQVAAWIERAAEKMPEEEYAFKPDPAVRSFGQILGHIADANYLFCSPVLGENSPSPGIEKNKTTKAELTSSLRDAFAYCGRAYDTLTDASANETIKAFGQERNKLAYYGSIPHTTWSTMGIWWSTCGQKGSCRPPATVIRSNEMAAAIRQRG